MIASRPYVRTVPAHETLGTHFKYFKGGVEEVTERAQTFIDNLENDCEEYGKTIKVISTSLAPLLSCVAFIVTYQIDPIGK